ncbi:MAG: hypothetical protein ABSF60_04905 [Verrucomicrobiota bacterium]
MIQILGQPILRAAWETEGLLKLFETFKNQNPAVLVPEGNCKTINRMLGPMDEVLQRLVLPDTKRRRETIKIDMELYPYTHNYSQIYTILWDLHRSFIRELMVVHFAFISGDKLQFFEQEELFGETVYENFKIAREDIKAAGNCLAADLHDAAVFHLLRVVEIGLRELAKNLGIKKISKTPLDYSGWEKVVGAINDKLEVKIPKSRGPKKSAALKLQSELLADLKAFEVLRNEIMHGRSHHNEQEAIGLFNRVREFMQRLANAISSPKSKTKSTGKSMWSALAPLFSDIGKK